MEMENNAMLPFLGTQLLNKSSHTETKVFVKLTNSGLLLHYKSHVDDRYKRGLLKSQCHPKCFAYMKNPPFS